MFQKSKPPQPLNAEQIEALAAGVGIAPEELSAIASDWGCTEVFAAEILAEDQARRRARRDEPPPAPKRRRTEEPYRPTLDAAGVVARAQSAGAGVVADRMLPEFMRPAAHGRPAYTSYRSLVVRRIGDPLERPLWFYSHGAIPAQIKAWLESGRRSDDPVERAVTALLRIERNKRGAFRKIFHVAAIAHFLWYNARRSHVPGFSAYVDGIPRGEIARRSAHYFRGQPLHPDTISRYLRELGIVLGGSQRMPHLGGVLEWEQVPPEVAEREKLPKATHHLINGGKQIQAYNIYRWRDAGWIAAQGLDSENFAKLARAAGAAIQRNAPALAAPEVDELRAQILRTLEGQPAYRPPDLDQGYYHPLIFQRLTLDLQSRRSKESPSATIDPAGRGPASLRGGSARASPPAPD